MRWVRRAASGRQPNDQRPASAALPRFQPGQAKRDANEWCIYKAGDSSSCPLKRDSLLLSFTPSHVSPSRCDPQRSHRISRAHLPSHLATLPLLPAPLSPPPLLPPAASAAAPQARLLSLPYCCCRRCHSQHHCHPSCCCHCFSACHCHCCCHCRCQPRFFSARPPPHFPPPPAVLLCAPLAAKQPSAREGSPARPHCLCCPLCRRPVPLLAPQLPPHRRLHVFGHAHMPSSLLPCLHATA